MKSIIQISVFYFIAYYIGNFSAAQSSLLSFLVFYVYTHFKNLKKENYFTPHYLGINPNWDNILKESKYFEENELLKVRTYLNSDEAENKRHISIEFLSTKLIYCRQLNYFTGKPNFRLDLPLTSNYGPKLEIARGKSGIEIRIFTNITRKTQYDYDDGYICLGTIPYEIFEDYYTDQYDFNMGDVEDSVGRLQKVLNQYELKRGGMDDDSIHDPSIYIHKYFEITESDL